MIEGGYLKLTGRIKETYRCGGEMVMPREIEDLLTGYPGVAQVLAVGIPDIRMGEVGCLCVVPEPGSAPELNALIAHCAAHLAKFKVPRYAVLLRAEDIPLTVTGRPQKFKLARLAAELVHRNELSEA
jgi:fatty-acyl-CoA synthase